MDWALQKQSWDLLFSISSNWKTSVWACTGWQVKLWSVDAPLNFLTQFTVATPKVVPDWLRYWRVRTYIYLCQPITYGSSKTTLGLRVMKPLCFISLFSLFYSIFLLVGSFVLVGVFFPLFDRCHQICSKAVDREVTPLAEVPLSTTPVDSY